MTYGHDRETVPQLGRPTLAEDVAARALLADQRHATPAGTCAFCPTFVGCRGGEDHG